ncbi:polysaccharide lyase 3 family protein [Abortiporus biennis]
MLVDKHFHRSFWLLFRSFETAESNMILIFGMEFKRDVVIMCPWHPLPRFCTCYVPTSVDPHDLINSPIRKTVRFRMRKYLGYRLGLVESVYRGCLTQFDRAAFSFQQECWMLLNGRGFAHAADVPVYGQCGGLNWTGDTTCASGSTCVYQNDYYSQCVPSGAAPTTTTKSSTTTTKSSTTTTKSSTTTTKTTTTSAPAGSATKLPASSGYVALPTASIITGSFDGKMFKYDRKGSSGECQEQTETGEDDAVFILESGASISNVIVGKDQAEGIHCRGPCTVTNVWWEDVCEDAITIKQTGAGDVSTITGGGAFHAEDKIVQHNGAGTVHISNFYANDFGKLYRACGNSLHTMKGTLLWIISVWSTAVKTSGKPNAEKVCCTYTGVNKGSEPPEIGCGDGYSACIYNEDDVGTCS